MASAPCALPTIPVVVRPPSPNTASTTIRLTTFGYNAVGLPDAVTDPLGQITRFEYDAAGRLTSQTRPDGATITTSYDANGNATSVTPPGKTAHTFAYTGLGQLSGYLPPPLSPVAETTTYSYTQDRQLSRVVRPDGQTTDLAYDSASRLTSLTVPNGQTSFTYDPATGSLASISTPDGLGLTYTRDGTLVTSETATGPGAGSTSRTYDSDFRARTISAVGATTAFTYDADSLTTAAGELAITHNQISGLTSETRLDGISDSRTYDGFGQLTGYTAAYNNTTLLSRTIDRDPLGRIINETETIAGTTHTSEYEYDAAGRLTDVSRDGIPAESYVYDANGNRLTSSVGRNHACELRRT